MQDGKKGTEKHVLSKKKKKKKEVFLTRPLLGYCTTPPDENKKNPSALMGKQIRASTNDVVIPQIKKSVVQKRNKESNRERAEFIIQKGHNTAIINTERGNSVLAHANQIRSPGQI